ncbi:cytochrome C [Komarekiella sp. 'clone 1']|uniref:Cytochrome C n=1 Tax=Komarekiella delphini-convector SJRDD-AB1 TaxID=2593771 RepID=A0AA40SSS1_9NOST|nr:diheme cytochrome c [Komarekiella delphini-convector]MBD6614606.1 cytochrome C [Komarekiella delphini-convector SJRDD-AB1]
MSIFVKRKTRDREKRTLYSDRKVLQQNNQRQLKPQPFGLLLIVLAWSIIMGWLLSSVTSAYSATPTSEVGTVDIVPAQYQLGQQLYLENCSTCHLALPPAVLPTQTWKNLLQDSQHYGAQLQPLVDPPRVLVWKYLSTFSRTQLKDEETPYRVNNSRYFRALHPKVNLPRPVQIGSCVSCHPSASEFNFRRIEDGG